MLVSDDACGDGMKSVDSCSKSMGSGVYGSWGSQLRSSSTDTSCDAAFCKGGPLGESVVSQSAAQTWVYFVTNAKTGSVLAARIFPRLHMRLWSASRSYCGSAQNVRSQSNMVTK